MLERLWSPSGLFDEISFRPGINIVMGRYAGAPRDSGGINGIGKSTVVRLIDFLLISDGQRRRFSSKQYRWLGEEDHVACLQLTVNGTQVSVRRSFGLRIQQVFVRIAGRLEMEMDEREAKARLGAIFFPEQPDRIGADGRFRSLMPFYIKDDLTGHSRIDPVKFLTHQGSNQRDLTILTLYLLGLPNAALVQLEAQRSTADQERRTKDGLRKRLEADSGKSVEVLRTDLSSADKHINELTRALSQFNLLEDFKEISTTIATLELSASELRKRITQSGRQIDKLHRFFEVSHEIDTQDVVSQYREISAELGAAVKRSLTEVLEFRDSLAEQRKRFHGKRLVELEAARSSAMQELSALENKRATLMRAVEGTDFSETFEGALQRLVSQHGSLERYRALLVEFAGFDQRLSLLELEMERHRYDAVRAMAEVEEVIAAIRERFLEIVSQAVTTVPEERVDAFFDIAVQTGPKAKQLPVKISVSLPRVDALGSARLLLVAYDLTIFLHQTDAALELPRFLVHDGAFHAVARRTVVKALNYAHRQAELASAEGRPFQYIVTFNEDELTVSDEERVRDGSYEFDLAERTVVTVSDLPSEMLFRRKF